MEVLWAVLPGAEEALLNQAGGKVVEAELPCPALERVAVLIALQQRAAAAVEVELALEEIVHRLQAELVGRVGRRHALINPSLLLASLHQRGEERIRLAPLVLLLAAAPVAERVAVEVRQQLAQLDGACRGDARRVLRACARAKGACGARGAPLPPSSISSMISWSCSSLWYLPRSLSKKRSSTTWWGRKVGKSHLWDGPRRASEATARPRAAQAALCGA